MTPWTAAYQAPPSMGYSRQEDWSGMPLPSPRLSPKDSLLQPYYFLRQLEVFSVLLDPFHFFKEEKKNYELQNKNQNIISPWIAHEAWNIVTKPRRS